MATLLRYPYEVRGHEAYFEDIPDVEIPEEMRDLATHIVERKAAKFDPSRFEDRYEDAVVEILRSKETGQPVHIPEAPRPSNVVNLMDALRRSIAAEKGGAPERASKGKAPSKTSAEREKAKEPAKKARKARKAG
jgi:DNA end-binding protein Ku